MNNKKRFVASILIFIVVFFLDYFCYEQITFHDNAPNFTFPFILRSFTLFLSTYLFITTFENKALKYVEKESFLNGKLNRIGLSIGIILTTYFSYLLIFKNEMFDALAKEDNIIEYSSALLAFLSSIILLFSYFKFFHSSRSKNTLLKIIVLAIAFGLFLIAMEEISWFQRIIGYKTSGIFLSNGQREVNLHNFRTDYVEIIYYFGAFIFFLFIPYLKLNKAKFIIYKNLDSLAPSTTVLILGALSCSFNYDMWNRIFMQMAFYGCLIVLWQLSKMTNNKNECLFLRFILVFIIIAQIIFLSFGKNYIRIWSITEYREFIIPFGFLIYSFDFYLKLKKNNN